jgi:methyl-accepting chemotaxis protein
MKLKLMALCTFFMTIILFVGGFGLSQTFHLVDRLYDISEVQLPALRKVGIVDMYHEGLQGLAYQSLFAAETNDLELRKEVAESFLKASTEMKKLLSEIELLNIKEETKLAIKDSLPAIEDYIKSAGEIIKLSENGKRTEAIVSIKKFNETFSQLEKKLDILGGLIEEDSSISQKLGHDIAEEDKKISIVIIILSLIIGTISSWFIVTGLMKSISYTVEELSKSVNNIQNSSQKVQLVSNQLTRTVDSQVSSITESVTAMDEISAMIQNNNQSATNAANLSGNTKSSAVSGKMIVEKMMKEMHEISLSYDEIQNSINKNAEDIRKIVEVIAEVGKKTEVINDIVFQTKLLSFNASVEAARAGESGKGFSVVAEEVGNLAQMSGKASSDIAEMLKNSQDQVKGIAETTTKNISSIVKIGRDKVQSGNAVAAECLVELEKIISCVSDLDQSINEISVAIREQSTGVNEVNISLKHLNDSAHVSTDMSHQSKEASIDLEGQSHILRTTIQGLRIILGAKIDHEDARSLEKINLSEV